MSRCPGELCVFVSAPFRSMLREKRERRKCWSFLKIEEQIRTRNNSLTLTPLELDIMKAVWQRHPITVRDVQAAIYSMRPLAYTTVMTIMHRLYLKGFLLRTLRSKAHYYEPAVPFPDVRDAAVSGIIDHFFDGSRERFLNFLESDAAAAHDVTVPAALDETLL
jgi:predicted transcriptional regulator